MKNNKIFFIASLLTKKKLKIVILLRITVNIFFFYVELKYQKNI